MVQTDGETRFVVDRKVNPMALVGHLKLAFAPERMEVVGVGSADTGHMGSCQNPLRRLFFCMATTTLNISLSQDQVAWVKSRREEGGFGSASDVIRDLIRRERDKELARLEAEFEKMDKRDGADGPAPVEEIVSRVKKIRADLLRRHETRRRP